MNQPSINNQSTYHKSSVSNRSQVSVYNQSTIKQG